MSDTDKPKRGPGRPPNSGNKFNLNKLKKSLPEITEAGDLIRTATMNSVQELIKMSMGMAPYEDASCTNRLGAHKELVALGLKFLEDEIVESLKKGAKAEAEEQEAKAEKQEEQSESSSDNIFRLKRHES